MRRDKIDQDARSYFDTPVSLLEVIHRIYTIKTAAGLTSIEDLVRGEITYRDLLQRHAMLARKTLRSPSVRERLTFVEASRRLVAHDLAAFNVPVHLKVQVVRNPNATKPTKVHFLVRDDDGDRPVRVTGFHCLLASLRSYSREYTVFRRHIAFESTFYTRYWLMVPAKARIAAKLASEAHLLGLDNVGVTEVAENQRGFAVLLHPLSDPMPNRQALLGRL